jgi:hypothetical protein
MLLPVSCLAYSPTLKIKACALSELHGLYVLEDLVFIVKAVRASKDLVSIF